MPFVLDPLWQSLGEGVAQGDAVTAAMLLDRARDDASVHLPPLLGRVNKHGSPRWLRAAAQAAIKRNVKKPHGIWASGNYLLADLAKVVALEDVEPVLFREMLRLDRNINLAWSSPDYQNGSVAFFREPADSPRLASLLGVVCVLASALCRECFLACRRDEGSKTFPLLLGWRNTPTNPDALLFNEAFRLLRWQDEED